jgi:hypothetical protein
MSFLSMIISLGEEEGILRVDWKNLGATMVPPFHRPAGRIIGMRLVLDTKNKAVVCRNPWKTDTNVKLQNAEPFHSAEFDTLIQRPMRHLRFCQFLARISAQSTP